MPSWSFSKYDGCGNDFIVFDNQKKLFPIQNKRLIQQLCHRQKGIGADGIILLERSSEADFKMRIFNADGSEAEMCGNGIRCLARFISDLGFSKTDFHIETKHSILPVFINKAEILVGMSDPKDFQWNLSITADYQKYRGHFLNTGVPHYVLFLENVKEIDLTYFAPSIRHHAYFSPHGTNVNIAEVQDEETVFMRTFERGVEDETHSCGTGATAVALAAAYQYGLKSPIYIQTGLYESLIIHFQLKNNVFSNVTMSGPAQCTYHGIVQLA